MFFNMLFAARVVHDMLCALLVHGNLHSQCPKMYKQQKRGNKMENDIENSRLLKAQTGQTIKKLR